MSISGQERMRISIHTSAREVTHFFSFLSYDIYISIHTSAREVTKCSLRCIAPCCISIHTSAREVTERERDPEGEGHISIHTSAREVTIMYDIYYIGAQFQSTLPQGKWHKQTGHPTQGLLFQSTLPQGKWRWRHWLKKILIYFNPHFRKGSDDYLISSEWLSKNISIHTSAREVTGSTPEMCKGSGISIHTSAREVTSS